MHKVTYQVTFGLCEMDAGELRDWEENEVLEQAWMIMIAPCVLFPLGGIVLVFSTPPLLVGLALVVDFLCLFISHRLWNLAAALICELLLVA